jgi:hypothetical protein
MEGNKHFNLSFFISCPLCNDKFRYLREFVPGGARIIAAVAKLTGCVSLFIAACPRHMNVRRRLLSPDHGLAICLYSRRRALIIAGMPSVWFGRRLYGRDRVLPAAGLTAETSQRFDVVTLRSSSREEMSNTSIRATVYFDPDLHRALRLKAAHTRRPRSDLVNEAVRLVFQEDQEDLAAFEERVKEPLLSYEALLNDLKKHGKL